MKILLLGRNGQLGWELQRSLGVLGEVVALGRNTHDNPGRLSGDLRNLIALRETLQQVRPQVIVNAAGYTNVDMAEADPDHVRDLNLRAPRLLAEQAAELGAWLVHYSTDYVFNGSGTAPWRETDTPAPLNLYGQTKLAGERAVISTCPHYLLLRSSWVFSARGDNFARTMLRLAATGAPFNVVDDQIGAPTSAELLADVTAHMLRAALAQPKLGGIYHCASAGETSWHAYARFVVAQARAMGWPLLATPEQIAPIASRDYPTPARRPLNSRLCCDKLTDAFGLHLPPWQGQVQRMLETIRPQPAAA